MTLISPQPTPTTSETATLSGVRLRPKMVTMRNPFKRQDSVDATAAPELHHTASAEDVKSPVDEKDGFVDSNVGDTHEVHGHNPWEDAGEENRLANGKERPIEVSSGGPSQKALASY